MKRFAALLDRLTQATTFAPEKRPAINARLARVVTMAAVSSSSPLGPIHVSHSPAKANGPPDLAVT